MVGDREDRITRLPELWDVIRENAPRGEWVPIETIYAIVEANVTLRREDFAPAAPRSRQTKWRRNIRNVLQHRKTPMKTRAAQILWDAPTRSYLIPTTPGVMPPDLLAPDERYVPPDPPSLEIDEIEALVAESMEDARRRTMRAIVTRQGARDFRASLLKAYDGRCAITTTSGRPALEAAHIVPYRGPATNHVANGLLLRADVHTLFDLGLIAVNPLTMLVETARDIERTDYAALRGGSIAMPGTAESQPSQRSLLYHYRRSRVVA